MNEAQVNGIEDAHKVPIMFSVIGDKTYDLLRNLLSPTDPKDKTFDELVEALKCCAKKEVLKVTVNCYRCGKSNHKPINCPVKGLRYHNCACGKVGHMHK